MLARAGRVRFAAFDIDGVLTDGRLYYSGDGDAMKAFDVRDGMGMKLLQDAGIEIAIITSRKAESVRLRAADLGIRRVMQGVPDKRAAI
ncbi:MAG: KdsC family phosphatase [Burkholderiales bacterium]